MLGTQAATVIALINLVASGVIGVAAGFIACLMFRLPWNIKVAALDAIFAFASSIASAFAYAAIAIALGYSDSVVKWVFLTASASVVLRHLVRLWLRRRAAPVTAGR